MGLYLTAIQRWRVKSITAATLAVETSGSGFFEMR